MRKKVLLIVKCILVILPFIILSLYTKTNMIKFVDTELPYFIWNKDFCNTTHEKYYEVVVLGDSVANAAYIPEVLSDNTVNLSLGGTNPIDSYYILEEYLENNRAPKTVYVSFLDLHFQTADWFWTRTMFMHRFGIEENIEMLKMGKQYNEQSIIKENYLIDFLSYQLYLPNKYITALSNASFNQRYENNKMLYEDNNVFNGRYMAKGVNEWTPVEVMYSGFTVGNIFEKYYTKIIEMCIDKGIQVRLVKLPLPQSTVYTDEYIQQVNLYYEQLLKKYPEVTFDWFNWLDDNNFADQNHMNTHEAFRFSQMIKQKYPEDFSSEFSVNRMNALNRNIMEENWLQDMFMWNDCGQYTFLVNDSLGNFEELFYSSFKTDKLLCKHYENIDNIYLVGKENLSENIILNQNVIEVYLGEQKYDWNINDINGFQILVIDNYNNSIVCEKNFKYVENSYFQLV